MQPLKNTGKLNLGLICRSETNLGVFYYQNGEFSELLEGYINNNKEGCAFY